MSLVIEESEREIALTPGPAFMDVAKVKVSKKALTLTTKDLHRSGQPSIQFLKKSRGLSITCSWYEFKYKKCELGHDHRVGGCEKEFQFFHLPDEHIEQLVEWLTNGTWSQLSMQRPNYMKVLKEAHDLIEQLKPKDGFLKTAATTTMAKIKKELVYEKM